MAKWLTSLALIVALGGSVLAGMPLHSDEQECTMSGMNGDMDCCAKARKQDATPEVTTAQLCCAVNCPSSGTTPPTSSVQRTPILAIVAQHPAIIQSPFVVPSLRLRTDSTQDHPQNSKPTYIRHLALLI
jgi:hypothetical protein